MIERIIEFSAKKRFWVILGVFMLSVWGIWAITKVPLDAIPDLSDTQVIVFTEWPGRSPDLVEDQITYPITTTLLASPRVTTVRGVSMFGFSFVYVLFEEGTDIYWARSRILEYLSGIRGELPEGVSPDLGPDATGVGWVYQYALVDESGKHDLSEIRSFQDWYLRYWLQSVPGVSEIAGIGGFTKQYQVNIDPNRLIAYNISLRTVIDRIRMSNEDVGGRVVEWAGREYVVRGRGYIESVEDIENIVVSVSDGRTASGTPVLLRDLADIQIGPDMRRGVAELDGRGEVVGGTVVARFGENSLDIINRVKERIEDIKDSFPEGIELVTTYDRSELIVESIWTLVKTLIFESIIVSIVCFVFLYHFRSALVVIMILPLAVLFSFIPTYYMGITTNIMSLGGIALAIGALVDAGIVIVENIHKRLGRWEQEGNKESRLSVIIDASKEVGAPIFFALMIITISFIPVFALEAQEGRLFKPLAYLKVFTMAFAAVLSITLTVALAAIFIRGSITPEEKNPLSRFLIRVYDPVVQLVLRYRKTTVIAAVVIFFLSLPIFFKLGSEFMPPLYEGVIMDMPMTPPGLSITEAGKYLQLRNKIIKEFPEVKTVFGKAGRLDTPTDPAPLTMIETNIILKPESEWRKIPSKRWYSEWAPEILKKFLRPVWPEERRMEWQELVSEMDSELRFPGFTNMWTMPIKNRVDMLSTGFRTPVGIKISGPDFEVIERIGEEIEGALRNMSGTRNIFAERVRGGYYLDFNIRRDEAARYGFSIRDVQEIVESAIGGKNVTTTIEGRERYTVNVRYARELRDELDKLKRVLVTTPSGANIPIGYIADIDVKTGPPEIRTEDSIKAGFVHIDVEGRDLGGYVEEAKTVVAEKIEIPPKYHLEWSGQYEYMERVKDRLKLMLPVTLFIIFLLLYLNFRNFTETILILLSVPFASVGGIWLMYLLGYNMSVASWVGFIALAGLTAQTGVVIMIYMDNAYKDRVKHGMMNTWNDLFESIREGAVQRVRPKMMTETTTFLALMFLMFSEGAGADTMKRIAAPMVGGVFTSTILVLIVMPAIYAIWKGRSIKSDL